MKSSIKRRDFIKIGGYGSAALLLPGLSGRLLAQAGPELQAMPLRENLVLFTGAGCNVLVKRAADGQLLIVDGGLAEHAEALLALIRAEMGAGAVATLVNSHWHREQTGLNEALGAQGVKIFAHENTRQWLGTSIQRLNEEQVYAPLPAHALPTETFFHYGDLAHGDGKAQYGYLRQAHTDGDMYVYFPEDNVLHTGGAISSDTWPQLDWWTGGWIRGLAEASATLADIGDDATVVVPAHGPVIDKARLIEMRDMYGVIAMRMGELYNGAKSAREAVEAKPAAEFEAAMGNADGFILQAFLSMQAHITPDA